MSATTPTSDPAGERRYTEEELALILNRAAERQKGVQASAPRYSWLPGEQLVGEDTERIDVRAMVDGRIRARLLGRQ